MTTKQLSEIRVDALADLEGYWGGVIKLTLVTPLVIWLSMVALCIRSSISFLCLANLPTIYCQLYAILLPLSWGYHVSFLRHARNESGAFKLENLFLGYKSFGRVFTTCLLLYLYSFLYMMVFRFDKLYAYSLTPYILLDYPELNNTSAMRLSSKMMEGNKWTLFRFHLSFWWLYLLAMLSLGIGCIWLVPYISISHARFYEQVKEEYKQSHSIE